MYFVVSNVFYILFFSWFPKLINVFGDKENFKNLKPEKFQSFYNSVTTLISNQVIVTYTSRN